MNTFRIAFTERPVKYSVRARVVGAVLNLVVEGKLDRAVAYRVLSALRLIRPATARRAAA